MRTLLSGARHPADRCGGACPTPAACDPNLRLAARHVSPRVRVTHNRLDANLAEDAQPARLIDVAPCGDDAAIGTAHALRAAPAPRVIVLY